MCVALLCTPAAEAQLAVKQIAAPPEDVAAGVLRLPDPFAIETRSQAALLPVEFELAGEVARATLELPVDGHAVAIVPLGVDAAAWSMTLRGADDIELRQGDAVRVAEGDLAPLRFARPVPVVRYDVHLDPGPRRLVIETPVERDGAGYVLVGADDGPTMSSGLAHHDLVMDRPIELWARVDGGTVTEALVEVRSPTGRKWLEEMRIDDALATGGMPVDEPGEYAVRIETRGDVDGVPFVRTTQHVVPIVRDDVSLSGDVAVRREGRHVELAFEADAPARRFIMGAEVWGTTADGEIELACWIGGMVQVERGALQLAFDERWLDRAGVGAPIVLRNVRVQDAELFIPLERHDEIVLDVDRAVPVEPVDLDISEEMLTGRPRAKVFAHDPPESPAVGGGHNLMLSHGYCAGDMPFPVGHFNGSIEVFMDLAENRSHDQFAILLHDFGALGKSFGIVAHSQGGAAALHLFTYYWSGLDWSQGNRLIQSVGTPYQGTALAGNAAVLGEIFGAGCGTNFDLTYDGAALWLSGIPTWARQRVYYHTTSFDDGIFYDYCHLVTDLLLEDPDDGTTEAWAGQLPGANNMGHVEGWCHTTGMRDPPQATDASRNAVMNTNANR